MKRRGPAVLAALMVTMAGCAHGAARDTGAPPVEPAWHSCATDRDSAGGIGGSRLRPAASFTPVAAVLCRTADRRRPGGGIDQLAVEDRATDITALVAALRLPDDTRPGGGCSRALVVPPWLALIDARGRWVHPGVPVDTCRHPRPEVFTAIRTLHTTRVSTRVLNTVVSDGAAASGCGQSYADMAWAVLRNDPARTAAPTAAPTPGTPVKVCLFRVPAGERGGVKPGGRYESSWTLTPQQWAAVERELARSGPPAPCPTSAGHIAVLAGGIVAELDGCRLVLIGGMARRGTPELARLLSPAGR